MRDRILLISLVGLVAIGVAILPSCANSTGDEPLDCASDNFCEEVNSRYKSAIEDIVDGINSCDVREDCTSAIPSLGCADQATWLTTCAQPIRADAVDDFHHQVAGLEDQFCSDCDLECHHNDEYACTAPIAKCEQGRCIVEFAEDVSN